MNDNTFNIKEVKAQLPHGAIVQIAKLAGVLPQTVSRALNGNSRSEKLPIIIKATADYLKEYNTRESEANQALKEALETKKL